MCGFRIAWPGLEEEEEEEEEERSARTQRGGCMCVYACVYVIFTLLL
jgi:hypothetical protein